MSAYRRRPAASEEPIWVFPVLFLVFVGSFLLVIAGVR